MEEPRSLSCTKHDVCPVQSPASFDSKGQGRSGKSSFKTFQAMMSKGLGMAMR